MHTDVRPSNPYLIKLGEDMAHRWKVLERIKLAIDQCERIRLEMANCPNCQSELLPTKKAD